MKKAQKKKRAAALIGACLLCILSALTVFGSLHTSAAIDDSNITDGVLTDESSPLLSFHFNLQKGVKIRTPTKSGYIYSPMYDTSLPSYYLTGRDAFIVCRINKSGYYTGDAPQDEYCTFYAKSEPGAVCGINVSYSDTNLVQTFICDTAYRYSVWGDNFNSTEESDRSFDSEFNQVRITMNSFFMTSIETKEFAGGSRLKLYNGSELISEYPILDFTVYYYLNDYFRCYSDTIFSLNSDLDGDLPFVTVSSPAILSAFSWGYDNGMIDFAQPYYNKGYNDGFAKGEEVHELDYSNGFSAGQTETLNSGNTFKDMIFAIFGAPVELINGILDFNLLGINVLSLVKTLVTLAITALIVVGILKMTRG